MTKITLLGGSLGAGKTTLLLNMLRSESLTDKDGIIVMDAAGDIDYSRIRKEASARRIGVANATSACTVCDGPESVFKNLSSMNGLDNVIIELSGQMPLSVMRTKLLSKGVDNASAVYLVDPRNFGLVQGADEVPYADVVGFTKTDASLDITRYNPSARVLRIRQHDRYTLSELLADIKPVANSALPTLGHSHTHAKNKGDVSKWFGKVANPYHTESELKGILLPIALMFDRIKGYVALDAEYVFSFDGVQGRFSADVLSDPDLGNGMILLANGKDKYFSESKAEETTAPLTTKPDPSPVLRRGSSVDTFTSYISQALQAHQYDDAMGASEQYSFESGDDSLMISTLPEFARGKLQMIQSGELTLSQRLLQGMSALYYLVDNPENAPQEFRTLSQQYRLDFSQMTKNDWQEVSDPEILDYIHTIREKL